MKTRGRMSTIALVQFSLAAMGVAFLPLLAYGVAPVASNQTVSLAQGAEVLVSLAWSDADQPALQSHTFSVVSNPVNATLMSYYQRYSNTNYPNRYYVKAATSYAGPDSFTWKCNDGVDDSNVGTVTLTITDNNPPVINSSVMSVPSGQQGAQNLTQTDADVGQTWTRSVVNQPANGTASIIGNWVYYVSVAGYAGPDSFTWKCSDGVDDSNLATVTVTVTASPPVPRDITAAVCKDVATEIPALYSGGGGYAYYAVKVSGPLHGTVVVTNGTTFRYTPASNYLGGDSFTWRMVYNGTGTTATVACSLFVKDAAGSGDWPQWSSDEFRSAMSVTALPAQLHMQWRRDFPAHTTCSFMQNCDIGSQPVVAGKTMVVNISGIDKVVALNTDTGATNWHFYADGPIRVGPAICASNVFVPSDDGCVYVLDLGTGSLVKKFMAGPSNRKVFGNKRLISPWMVRGGPVVFDSDVCFAAGVWPFEGIFTYRLDGANGNEVWRNDDLGGQISGQPHDQIPVVSGPSPQGYLVRKLDGGTLYVPGTEAYPARLDPLTGKTLYWLQGSGTDGSANGSHDGGYKWPLSDGTVANGTLAIQAVAGARSYTPTDASALGVAGTVNAMLVADGKLFVATREGCVYCFGGTQVSNPPAYIITNTPLPDVNDVWSTNVQQILSGAVEKEGCLMVLGVGTGRLVDELVKQSPTNAHIVVIDPDPAKVLSLRLKMDAAGVYGNRVAAFAGDPIESGLPPYVARLILSEDLSAAGYTNAQKFVSKVYYSLMPYDGMAWLPIPAGQHSAFTAAVSAASLQLVTTGRTEPFSILQRTGLAGGSNHKAASMTTCDKTLQAPLGILWFDRVTPYQVVRTQGDIYYGRMTGGCDAYTGLTLTVPRAWDGTNGIAAYEALPEYNNPFIGAPGSARALPTGYGCGNGMQSLGYIFTGRAGNAAFHDFQTDSGTIQVAGIRSVCGSGSGIPGCGILYEYGPGCGCAYSLEAFTALVSVPGVENWARWGHGPTQDVLDEKPFRRVGINFGAPGDWNVLNDKLWVEFPARSAPSPNVLLWTLPSNPTGTYHHMSRITNTNTGKPWVAASNVRGVTNVTLRLANPGVVKPCAQAPAIDGSLADACWDGASGMALVNSTVEPDGIESAAFAWLRSDATNLYIALESPRDPSYERFDVYLCGREDCTAPFSNPYVETDVKSYTRFGVSVTGTKTNIMATGGIERYWAGAWTCAVTTGQMFCAEFAIPKSTLASAGIWPDQMAVNMFGPGKRRIRELDDSSTWSSAVPLGTPNVRSTPCYRFVPLYAGEAGGEYGVPLTNCSVKLHFAETEGATVGQRVFNVKLQGNTVLSNFDIVQQAGGANKAIVREFTGLTITNEVRLELVPVTGQTLISGLEVDGEYGARVNQAPVAVLDASTLGGVAPLTVDFSARNSSDPDGQVARCDWSFGDGRVAQGSVVSHTYYEGAYPVRLTVTDDAGAYVTATATITVGPGSSTADYVCKVRISGGDYTNLSSWEAATRSDLTSETSKVFTVSDRGSYAAGDDGSAVTFTGGGSGILKHINTLNKAYIVGCSGVIQAGPATVSGHTFTVSDTGMRIGRAIVEGYNDWTNGLNDTVTMSGWITDASHYAIIRAADGHVHSGKARDNSGNFTGFGLNTSAAWVNGIATAPFTAVQNTIIGRVDFRSSYMLQLGSNGLASSVIAFNGGTGIKMDAGCVVQNSVVHNSGTGVSLSDNYQKTRRFVYNTTVANCTVGFGFATGTADFFLANCLAAGCGTGFSGGNSGHSAKYCASSDATADDCGGEGNRINQTFAFVDAANKDFHLSASDAGARDVGCSGAFPAMDIDGDTRSGPWDIGADEAPSAADGNANEIPDSWEIQNFGSTNAVNGGAQDDWDSDGMVNLSEYIAGTNPTNAMSRFQISGFSVQEGAFRLGFLTVTGRTYGVAYKSNLLESVWYGVTNGVSGTGGQVDVIDSTSAARKFYRITVRRQ
ncbi:MAG: hypothetical protein C0404_07955 [Verrucomicrobia bacterium]|nr:hypothetical protein [Verrucomicrobiota bacterium]